MKKPSKQKRLVTVLIELLVVLAVLFGFCYALHLEQVIINQGMIDQGMIEQEVRQ